MPERLAMREQQVLDVLRQSVDKAWVGRSELAGALGRKRLNQGDFEALAALEAKGMIEVDKRPDTRPIGYQMFYRVKP